MTTGPQEARAGFIANDSLKVRPVVIIPDNELQDDSAIDGRNDEDEQGDGVPLTRTHNLYMDSPRAIHTNDRVSEKEIQHRRRVGISVVVGLVISIVICSVLLDILSETESFSAHPAIQHRFMDAKFAGEFKETLDYYSRTVRHTGSAGDYEMAAFIRSQAIEFGIDRDAISLEEFEMLVNEPKTLKLDVFQAATQNGSDSQSLLSYDFVAAHSEEQLAGQLNGSDTLMPYPAFHLYSKNGSASGALVYAHFGASLDYEALARANVSVQGKIVLLRAGGDVSLPAKVVLAAKFGAVGVLTYNDPADDGAVRGPTFPDGPWRPSTSASFGSVYMGDGDPTMPEGFSAMRPMGVGETDRLSVDDIFSRNNTLNVLPPIVSMPISASVAEKLLAQIETSVSASSGNPLRAADVYGARWQDGGLNVHYHLFADSDATSASEVVVQMENHNAYSLTKTWNVVVTLRGTREPNRHVIVGAPRDSLNAGAASPGSGNAVLLELLRALGSLLSDGWRPRRTLLLASFGGEQFGAAGSSRWIDHYGSAGNDGAGRGIVYLHLRDAVRGAGALRCEAAAVIRKNIYLMTATVEQPEEEDFPDVASFFNTNSSNVVSFSGNEESLVYNDHLLPISATFSHDELSEVDKDSVFAYWLKNANEKSPREIPLELPPMGRPGSFQRGRVPAFLGRLGIPSVSMGFDGDYFGVEDSSIDSLNWVSRFSDPEFAFHRAATQLYGSVLLSFSDALFLQYDFTEVSRELRRGEAFLADALAREGLTSTVPLTRLQEAIALFETAALSANHEMAVMSSVDADLKQVRELNTRMLRAQRAFLLPSGLTYMPWLKHVVYGISEWDDYRVNFFPGVTQELKRGNAMTVRRELVRLCLAIETAADILINTSAE